MRRTLVLALCTTFLALAAGAPAGAQRDPFDPLISEDQDAGSGGTTQPPDDDTGTDTTTTVADPAPDEPMPPTGGDPSRWLGLAVLVLTLGGGILLLARLLGQSR